MDKLTLLLDRVDELISDTQKKFDLALARQATAGDDEKPACKQVRMWAEIEYRDAKRLKEFIVETIG